MSRAFQLPRFAGKKPEELADLLERLVEELDGELRALRDARRGPFPNGVLGQVLSAATARHALAFGRIHRVDMQAGNVDLQLPYGRKEHEADMVGIVRLQAGNTLTVYPSGGQLVSGAASQALATAGLRIYAFTGGVADDDQGGWRLVT